MKIDRIEVIRTGQGSYYWQAIKEDTVRFNLCYYDTEDNVIAEARYLAKKLGCKLVLPEGGGK
jgi:hypothetical protein